MVSIECERVTTTPIRLAPCAAIRVHPPLHQLMYGVRSLVTRSEWSPYLSYPPRTTVPSGAAQMKALHNEPARMVKAQLSRMHAGG